ncbi:MAG: response regulator [Blautia sp.]
MGKKIDAAQTVKEFCNAWFALGEPLRAAEFLDSDVRFVGAGDREYAHGKQEMLDYIRRDTGKAEHAFYPAVTVIYEQPLSDVLLSLFCRLELKSEVYAWQMGGYFTLERKEEQWKIRNICLSDTGGSHEELLHIYNNIPGAVFRCRFDEFFSVIEANDGLFEFLGYTRQEFAAMGNRMSSVIYPDDLEIMAGKLREQLKYGSTIHNENRLICKDGSVKWISIKAQLITEKSGEQYFYCVFVDITEEKQNQERSWELFEKEMAYFAELSSSEKNFRGRMNVTKNCVESYVSALDDAITHVGATFEETVQNMAQSAVDWQYGEKISSALDREKVLADYSAGKVDYKFEFLRRRKDGSVFWSNTSFRSYLNPQSGDIIVFFYTFDVTEQKMQEQLLKKITDLGFELIADIDLRRDRYHLISFDERAYGILPRSGHFQAEVKEMAEQVMEEEVSRYYLEHLEYSYMEEQLEENESYSFIVEMKNEAGEQRVKRCEVFYIDRELGRACLARTDVTDVVRQEQRQKEEMAAALVAAEQANAAKSDFLSRMSHEIRTPMNAIIGMSTIAAQSIGDDEQVADCIAKIGISSRFLLSLINDILDMSRIESGKMLLKNEKIPTEEFLNGINSICHAQAAAKGVDYECIVDPVLDDYYMGDAMKLQQVLINILSNAIKFTGEGGKVTFSAAQMRRTKNDAVLRFVINDTGVGMNEEFIPHIFEPFSQESTGTTALYGGTGLGLAISKNIVDMMDGRIIIRSIKGIGSEFTVDVKLGITEEEKLHHNQRKQNYNFSHLKTLVVDDDVAVCESAMVTLKEMGISAEWADSGLKAVNRVKNLWNDGKYFDMILIDWKMPEMDGIETARRIRSIVGPEVTIIIMTAYDWSSIEHEAKMAGVNLLISKPMFKSSLISAFSRALGKKDEEKEEKKEADMDYDFTGKRVLLAEDHPLNTEIAVMLLEGKGFTVDTAENGLRALELFSKSEKGCYDAILMDIRMPLMDGLTTATNIRHLSNTDARTIPIIAMTANAFDDDIEKSKAAGMNAHLAKPIDPARLFQTLYDFIFRKEE